MLLERETAQFPICAWGPSRSCVHVAVCNNLIGKIDGETSASCAFGVQVRLRQCGQPALEDHCNEASQPRHVALGPAQNTASLRASRRQLLEPFRMILQNGAICTSREWKPETLRPEFPYVLDSFEQPRCFQSRPSRGTTSMILPSPKSGLK